VFIALPAAISAWFLVALILELAGKAVWRCGTATVNRCNDVAAKKRTGRRRAVQNLDHLDSNETESLCWIYHRHGRRVRADIRFSDIASCFTAVDQLQCDAGFVLFEALAFRVDFDTRIQYGLSQDAV